MPSRWRVTLPGIDAATVRLEHLHAVVSGWFDHDYHAHTDSAKPYTIAPPRVADTGAALEVSLLDDTLVTQLHAAAAPGSRIRLGSAWSRITHPPEQVAATTWAELAT